MPQFRGCLTHTVYHCYALTPHPQAVYPTDAGYPFPDHLSLVAWRAPPQTLPGPHRYPTALLLPLVLVRLRFRSWFVDF